MQSVSVLGALHNVLLDTTRESVILSVHVHLDQILGTVSILDGHSWSLRTMSLTRSVSVVVIETQSSSALTELRVIHLASSSSSTLSLLAGEQARLGITQAQVPDNQGVGDGTTTQSAKAEANSRRGGNVAVVDAVEVQEGLLLAVGRAAAARAQRGAALVDLRHEVRFLFGGRHDGAVAVRERGVDGLLVLAQDRGELGCGEGLELLGRELVEGRQHVLTSGGAADGRLEGLGELLTDLVEVLLRIDS